MCFHLFFILFVVFFFLFYIYFYSFPCESNNEVGLRMRGGKQSEGLGRPAGESTPNSLKLSTKETGLGWGKGGAGVGGWGTEGCPVRRAFAERM